MVIDMIAQPTAFVLRDRMIRPTLANAPTVAKRKHKTNTRKSRSPRSMVTISGTSYASAYNTFSTCERSEPATCLTNKQPPPTIEHAIPDREVEDGYSVFARENPPTRLGPGDTFGETVKSSVLTLATEFRETSTLLTGLRGSQIPGGKIALLFLEAVTTRSKSLESAKLIL